MRLYKLLRRVGNKTSSLLPWPDDPLAVSPEEFAGWRWDIQQFEWVKVPMAPIQIKAPPPVYEKPTYSPREEIPYRVPGWQWSDSMQEWVEVPMSLVRVRREMPRPPAPTETPRPLVKGSYRCWEWSERKGRWGYTGLTEMEKVRGFECDPKPEYPPGPEVPWRVDGWVWSSARLKWLESPMPLEWVEVEAQRPPRPVEAPREADPTRVPGWVWNLDEQEWAEIVYAVPVMEFDMPHSLPPGITQEALMIEFPLELQYKWAYENLIAQGLAPHEAKRIVDIMGEAILKTVWAQQRAMKEGVWKSVYGMANAQMKDLIEKIGAYGVLVIIAAVVGALVGTFLERFTRKEEQFVAMTPALRTYLMGPDDWYYAGCVGVSVKEVPYYKACWSIGAVNAHHLRGEPWGQDRIAFVPGGFLETGYKIPRWVKYRWEYWEIDYIGFLVRTGENLYRLQEGSIDPEQAGAARLYPPEQVCLNFTYYL